MKKKLLCKCFATLGLLLFFTLLIPFTSYNVATAQAASIDKEKSDSYKLSLKSKILVKGKSFTLYTYNLSDTAKVSFKSADAEIASVTEDGVVTGNKVGTTVVTATIKDGSYKTPLTCDITVGPPAISIKISRSRIILGNGNSDILNVIMKPSNTAEDAGFSSNDPSIVYTTPGGRITANKIGLTYLFAKIDARNDDGTPKFAVCTVIVTGTEDAPLLETYFNDHLELNMVPEADVTKALDDFFNGRADATAIASSKIEDVSKSSTINNLNRYLEIKFDLAKIRSSIKEALLEKSSQSQPEVTLDNFAK